MGAPPDGGAAVELELNGRFALGVGAARDGGDGEALELGVDEGAELDLVAVRAGALDKQRKAVQVLLGGWFKAIDYLKRDALMCGVPYGEIDVDRLLACLALDHRGTAALLMRGVDPLRLLREMLGQPGGLCGGQGGHMHLFAPDKLAASSGIVGVSGRAAGSTAFAAQMLRR